MSKLNNGFKCSVLVGVLSAVLVPHAARAALGEPEATVGADAQELKSSVKATQRASYRVHEMQLPSGTVLREYVAGGTVFAVTWAGPSMPNLKQMLGRYFDSFVAGAKTQSASRHHLQVEQGDLIVKSAGRMRGGFSGRAYLATGLPAGMSPEELR